MPLENRRSAQIAALAITLTAAHPALATPIRLSHQGRLLDASGHPLEGEHALVLTLTGPEGAPLWTDTFETELRSGYYHLILGSQRPLDGELFRDLSPGLSIGLEGEAPIALAETLTHVPYAAVAEWAREAHSVRGGLVDASEVRVNGQSVLQAGATTTLGRVRADQGLQLGAAATATCEAGTRGLLRYTSAGALEVCSFGGWVEVGGSEPGTCSIVGECPGGEEPSRVWFTRLELYSEEAVDLFCSRYDSAIGFVAVNGPFFDSQQVIVPCLGSQILSLTSNTLVPPTELRVEQVERVLHAVEASSTLQMPDLTSVGAHLSLRNTGPAASFPALQTVRAALSWTWLSGVPEPGPLNEFLPVLEHVGGSLTPPLTGPVVPLSHPLIVPPVASRRSRVLARV